MTTLNTIIEEENTPDTEVEIEQNAETGEVITANGVRLTPGTEWTEALQVEVMDGYLHLAEMRHFAKDPVAHMEEMREHWQKLQDFISTLLSSRDTYWKERVENVLCDVEEHASQQDSDEEIGGMLRAVEIIRNHLDINANR